jgi:hypothetical protein
MPGGWRALLTGRRILLDGRRILLTGRRILLDGRRILLTGRRILLIRQRAVVAGHRFLPIGRRARLSGVPAVGVALGRGVTGRQPGKPVPQIIQRAPARHVRGPWPVRVHDVIVSRAARRVRRFAALPWLGLVWPGRP